MVVLVRGAGLVAVHAVHIVVEGADHLDGSLERGGVELGTGIAANIGLQAGLVTVATWLVP